MDYKNLKKIASQYQLFRKCEQKILLFHGKSILQIEHGQDPINYTINQSDAYLKVNQDVLCLLATPLLVSYVHETIHLKKNELLGADKQFLSFSHIPYEKRTVESIRISEKKAVTIHSHLTQKGDEIITRLKKLKKGLRWQGAISYLVQNLLNYPQSKISAKHALGCFLEEDILKATWLSTIPHIQLIQNWLPLAKVQERLPYFRNILKLMPVQDESYVELDFNKQKFEKADLTLLTSLLFPTENKRKLRTFKKLSSKNGALQHVFQIKYLIIFIYGVIAIWLLVTEIEYQTLIERKGVLLQETGFQRSAMHKQKELVSFEKKYFQNDVLSELIRKTRFSLPERLQILENYLNKSSFWISACESDTHVTTLTLVTTSTERKKEIKELLNKIENLGKASLVTDGIITEKGVQLQEYKIMFTHHNQMVGK